MATDPQAEAPPPDMASMSPVMRAALVRALLEQQALQAQQQGRLPFYTPASPQQPYQGQPGPPSMMLPPGVR